MDNDLDQPPFWPLAKLPSKIRVGSTTYAVRYNKAELDAISVAQKSDYVGHTHHHQLVMTVDDTVASEVMRDTVLHEVLHALWYSTGLTEFAEFTEEQAVSVLAPALMSVLRNNPVLVQYLAGEQ